jgi:general secretion pathway protein N
MLERLARAGSPTQRISIIALALICIALAVVVDLEWQAPLAAASVSTAPHDASSQMVGENPPPRFSLPPIQSFSAVTARPLFVEDRRPAPESAGGSVGPWSSLTLAGIVIAPGSREALIRHGTPAVVVHLREGQSVDGWTVRSILSDRVVLTNGSEQHDLRLFVKSTPPAHGSPRTRR